MLLKGELTSIAPPSPPLIHTSSERPLAAPHCSPRAPPSLPVQQAEQLDQILGVGFTKEVPALLKLNLPVIEIYKLLGKGEGEEEGRHYY
eukprot:g23022.t1